MRRVIELGLSGVRDIARLIVDIGVSSKWVTVGHVPIRGLGDVRGGNRGCRR